jgi:hypothetical protein
MLVLGVFNDILVDVNTKVDEIILYELSRLIKKQMNSFSYLIVHCCFQPAEAQVDCYALRIRS